jgi:hypothetical protein
MDSTTVPQFASHLTTSGTYRETLLRSRSVEPERKLMLAILKDAFLKYKKHRRSNDLEFRDASRWFFQIERGSRFLLRIYLLGLGIESEPNSPPFACLTGFIALS